MVSVYRNAADPCRLTSVLAGCDTGANHSRLTSKRKGGGTGAQALCDTTRSPIRSRVCDELDFHTHGVLAKKSVNPVMTMKPAKPVKPLIVLSVIDQDVCP